MSRAAENKGIASLKIIPSKGLTSPDIQAHNLIEMEQTQKPGQKHNRVAYPLRFRSKAQKKRLEDAAKQVHKTLKDFLIDLGEQAAANMQREQQAS